MADVLEKLRGLDAPKQLAIIDLFGSRENMEACLRGEKKMTLEDVIRKFIDKNGRCIPAKELAGNVCDPNKKFALVQPQIDYGERLARLKRFFPKGMLFHSAEEFEHGSKTLIAQLKVDVLLSNLLNGVWLPICFPHMEIGDYGQILEEVFLASAEKSYKDQFPGQNFNNYRKGELAGKVKIVAGSRHERLLEKMKEGPVVGIQFFPMQGFSYDASREQIVSFPESFLLSGGIDTMTTVAMYPDVLGRDFNTPGYLCAANSWRSADQSLCAKADDGYFRFGRTGILADASDGCSSGVLFLR